MKQSSQLLGTLVPAELLGPTGSAGPAALPWQSFEGLRL
jgi:hypothetical protein